MAEKKTELLDAIIFDQGSNQDRNAVEEINILTVLKTIKLEYESLLSDYKKCKIPNKIDLNFWAKPSSLIIGDTLEPLASLFVPLVYAISAGTPAVLKLEKEGRLDQVINETLSKYLDSEMYVYSGFRADKLRELGFSQTVPKGYKPNDGVNVVALVDTELPVGKSVSEVVKWKEVLRGMTRNAPDVVLVHELHYQLFLDAAQGSQLFKVKVLDDPFVELPRTRNPGVLCVAVASTETVILLLQTRPVKLFTYLGTKSFGEYILKFAPQVTTANINEIRLTSYQEITRATFQDRRYILSSKKLFSNLGDAVTVSSYASTRLPRLAITYDRNIGFFEQGFFLSLGFIGLTTISAVSWGVYHFVTK